MQEFACPLCGSNKIEKKTDFYFCAHCGGKFRDEFAEEQKSIIRTLFGEELLKAKEEQIANVRSNLWLATHEQYTDSDKILTYARDLKNLLPDDFQANFYEISNGGNARDISNFLSEINVEESKLYLPEAIDFLIKSLEPNLVSAVKDLITRAYTGKDYVNFISRVEDEAVKLDEGVYTANLPRDVFLAYSSADMGKVNEVCALLEEQGFTCFVALRNLRHGRGAVQNYQTELQTAIKNCKCVVFLSSENSRSLSCDALKIELPYIKNSCPKMGKIEYLLEEYGKKTTVAAKTILKSFFDGLEWCRTEEDLIVRVVEYITKVNTAEAEERDAILREQQEKIARLEEMITTAKKAEQQAREAAARKAKEEQKAREEAERKAKEEAEQRAREEAARKAKAKAEQIISEEVARECEIFNGVLLKYKGNRGHVVIPSGVAKIGKKAFSKCKTLTSVIIPNGVTVIGESAFENCSSLTSVIIPKSVTLIEDEAFMYCTSLTSIIIPETVREIGMEAFYKCERLTIFCRSKAQPNGWDKDWNVINVGIFRDKRCDVVWGYQGK